jgi:hypothetical protein
MKQWYIKEEENILSKIQRDYLNYHIQKKESIRNNRAVLYKELENSDLKQILMHTVTTFLIKLFLLSIPYQCQKNYNFIQLEKVE